MLPHTTIINGYGASEIGGAAITRVLSPESAQAPQSVGRPFPNTRIYIVDKDMNLTPIGVEGEVCVAARHLARGYLNDVRETAFRFVPNPFEGELGTRLYRTGDFGRYLPNGEIEVGGRMDEQVKIRGFRVSCEEVARTIEGCAFVEKVFVTALSISEELQLVGYFVLRRGHPELSDLRNYIREVLPDYMRPAVLVVLDEMPMTKSGKIDRTALPPPSHSRPELSSKYCAPRNFVEERLADIWMRTIDIRPIGIYDSFLELGGDSLQAVDVMASIEEEFGLEIPIADFFSAPTVAELALRLAGTV
jgi:acyl-CoA synthetase (AMP-forming)/AMP-acid ligase II/acyl carrier protein